VTDVCSGENVDAMVVFAEAEVEGAGALVVERFERVMERPSVGII
jgi:hypothetical protein